MKYGIIEKDIFKEIEEKEFGKLKSETREIYIPIKREFQKDDETTIEELVEEVFVKDLDYGKSKKLLRDILEEDKGMDFKTILIGIAILIFGVLLGLVIGMIIWNKNTTNTTIQDTPPIAPVQENANLNTIEDTSKEIEKKNNELQDKLIQCEIENVKLQTKIEYIPSQNTKECPVCEDTSIITRELEQCKKDYNNFFTEEHKFLDYIGNEIYQNCKINESEECKNLYFNFRQNGL